MFEVKESPKIHKGRNCGEGNEYVNGQMFFLMDSWTTFVYEV